MTTKTTPKKSARAQPAERIAYGGVSPEINIGATKGLVSLERAVKAPQKITTHAPAHGGFRYHGGPVVTCPQVYLAFWGVGVDGQCGTTATRTTAHAVSPGFTRQ